MHDPLVVAFEIKRPWPKTSRAHNNDGTPAEPYRYWPALITVWHREPHGHDAGTVCHWRSMAWHVHHWKLQFPPLQELRRRLLTRCTWCGGPSRKGDAVNVSGSWDGERSPWWKGERGLYHSDCYSTHRAHNTCVCETPVFDYEGYGMCARCGHRRAYGMSAEGLTITRELRKIPTGGRRGQ